MNIYLFGRSSLSGQAFYEYFNSQKNINKIYSFSRYSNKGYKLDLKQPSTFKLVDSNKFKIISFAPIWDLSYFLDVVGHAV